MILSVNLVIVMAIIILQIILTIAIIFQKNLYYCAIFMSISSTLAAVLFVIFKAPDIALAEIAVGSALVPFVYIISITKQKEFLVLDDINDDNSKELINSFNQFCKNENLKLKTLYSIDNSNFELKDVFRKNNVDVAIYKINKGYEILSIEASSIGDRAILYIKNMQFNYKVTFVRIGENDKED